MHYSATVGEAKTFSFTTSSSAFTYPKLAWAHFPANKLVVGGKGVKLTSPPNMPAFITHAYFSPSPVIIPDAVLLHFWNICSPLANVSSTYALMKILHFFPQSI
jgi:hypothetical protein